MQTRHIQKNLLWTTALQLTVYTIFATY